MKTKALATLHLPFLAAAFMLFNPGPVLAGPPPEQQARHDRLDAQIGDLERGIGRKLEKIEGSRAVRAPDAEDVALEQQLTAYAEGMFEASQSASAAAKAAADSNGRTGETESLAAFETLAQRHEKRWNALKARIDPVVAKVNSGQIKIDKSNNPGRSGSLDLPRLAGQFESRGSVVSDHRGWDLSEILISSAKASAFLSCVSPCLAKNWSVCGACCLSAGSTAAAAWSSFKTCWNSTTWYNSWWKKPYCLSVLIAKLG